MRFTKMKILSNRNIASDLVQKLESAMMSPKESRKIDWTMRDEVSSAYQRHLEGETLEPTTSANVSFEPRIEAVQ